MRLPYRPIAFVLLLLLVSPLLIACGTDATPSNATPPVDVAPPATFPVQGTPPAGTPQVATPSLATPVGTPLPGTPEAPRILTAEELVKIQPNELGGIPVFMYHNIVTDPTLEGHLYRTADELYADMQWLYDNNFYMVGMNDVVRGQFDVPAGKHPVVFTFDDSSSMHISFEMGPDGQPLRGEDGDYVISPNTAVGVIERFADEHPDFGKAAHFATIPVFKFSWPEYEQDEWYEEKIIWLLANGYEIGNHSEDHVELPATTDEDFARNIGNPYNLVADIVDENDPNFAMGIITLPYGAYPEEGWTGTKLEYLTNGFTWDGREVKVEAAMLVCCGLTASPFTTDYHRLWIPRIRGDDPDYDRLKEEIANDWVVLYTSDGNPDTVTIPWPLPQLQWGKLDEEAITSRGLTLVKYHPGTGRTFTALSPQQRQSSIHRERFTATR